MPKKWQKTRKNGFFAKNPLWRPPFEAMGSPKRYVMVLDPHSVELGNDFDQDRGFHRSQKLSGNST